MQTITLHAPLRASWSEQYVRLRLAGAEPGAAVSLEIDGRPAEFQYTGRSFDGPGGGAEILLRIGFDKDQTRRLRFTPAGSSTTDLTRREIATDHDAAIGVPENELVIASGPISSPCVPPEYAGELIARPGESWAEMNGPFRAAGGARQLPIASRFIAPVAVHSRRLTQTNHGPLYIEYELRYDAPGHRHYTLTLRCYRHEPIVEVSERLGLGMGAALDMALNPGGVFDRVLSHRNFDFESDSQPIEDELAKDRPRDLLCRIQVPPNGEHVVPNNRYWFALFNGRRAECGMLGVLATRPGCWTRNVENMPQVYIRGGRAALTASLAAGERHWLLYTGAKQTRFTHDERLVFNRLHAEFNALRLDEHLDLACRDMFDASAAQTSGFLTPDSRANARRFAHSLPSMRRYLAKNPVASTADGGNFERTAALAHQLLDPTPERAAAMLEHVRWRFSLWVRQFQGFREERGDYMKNVIGFSRYLRGLMLTYELLRRDGSLTHDDIAELNSYLVFAARRILDPGRWDHSRTWLHPDHPDSSRDFLSYPGEHRRDALVWTNSLPNFQSDPLMALAHLAALLPDHPDSAKWLRFALDDVNRQLDAYAGKSGAWDESIIYVLYTLSYAIITFRVLRHRTGIDYFNDPRLRRVAHWLVRFLGPKDKRWDAYTYPGVGNSSIPMGGGEYLLAYASHLAPTDPLRNDLIAAYQRLEPLIDPLEHYPFAHLVMACDDAQTPRDFPRLESEHMDEIGVAMRHDHDAPRESYLFQKIGFAKDHYEGDESAFNWYAKGTPLTMDYGTYTPDIATASAHNLVELPDADYLRRGFLADHFFSSVVDYTRCEVPITLKLSHGRPRSFEEADGPAVPPLFFYIGDQNPLGPKAWTSRQLLFIKPDYLLLFDRVHAATPHRFNLHITGDTPVRDGSLIRSRGRFDLDLLCLVQHPPAFDFQTGMIAPGPERHGEGDANPHRQNFFRLYNRAGDVYRTLLFAKERGRDVKLDPAGGSGVKVVTPEYTDYVFACDKDVDETLPGGVAFRGRVGWIRQRADGLMLAAVPDGEMIQAFGVRVTGRGPWHWNLDGKDTRVVRGVPRSLRVEKM